MKVETLSWEVFEKHLREKSPSALSMGGTRGVRIGFNPLTQSMFIRLPVNANSSIPPNPYTEIVVEILKDETGFVLEIKTPTVYLFREFHQLAKIITEDFERSEQTAFGAFETAIRQWNQLTSRKKLLTEEQILGLHGELVFLRAIINVYGVKALSAWTGRNKSLLERHDFRVNGIDIEIKSTKSTQRIHVIHGLTQLQASLGHVLYLLSLKFESAGLGVGQSIYDEVKVIRKMLAKNNTERLKFEDHLIFSGYRENDADHYQEKVIFADQPMLVPIDDKFPRITKEILSNTLPLELCSRLDDVSYRVNIEGLGMAQGSEKYAQILGKIWLDAK